MGKFDDYFKKYPLVYKKVMKGEGPFTLDGRDEADMKRLIAMNIATSIKNELKIFI
jgi:hypothetical protein